MNQLAKGTPGNPYRPDDRPATAVTVGLGIQHVLAMFGATVLAPVLMGFDPNTAILLSGIATIGFYFITGGKVPSYLGSSFAFIAAVGAVSGYSGTGLNPNLDVALGGIVVVGIIYGLVALLVMWVGHRWIEKLFPDIVSGTIVGVIGISLAGAAVSQIGKGLFGISAALVTLATVVLWGVYAPGRIVKEGSGGLLRVIEVIPILIGGLIGYLYYYVGANLLGHAAPIDGAFIAKAAWLGLPTFTHPTFTMSASLTLAPVVIVLLAENLGHVKAIGTMLKMEDELDKQVGRTFLGDAVGTTFSGFMGGPGLTTYAENMAVMRLSNNFASISFVAAGLFAILLGFSPKFGAIIQSIPVPVIGGLSLAMFGLITAAAGSIWQRGIMKGSISFTETRTLLVAGIGLVAGAGNLTFKLGGAEISGIVSATLITVILYHLLHLGQEKVSVPVEYE